MSEAGKRVDSGLRGHYDLPATSLVAVRPGLVAGLALLVARFHDLVAGLALLVARFHDLVAGLALLVAVRYDLVAQHVIFIFRQHKKQPEI